MKCAHGTHLFHGFFSLRCPIALSHEINQDFLALDLFSCSCQNLLMKISPYYRYFDKVTAKLADIAFSELIPEGQK